MARSVLIAEAVSVFPTIPSESLKNSSLKNSFLFLTLVLCFLSPSTAGQAADVVEATPSSAMPAVAAIPVSAPTVAVAPGKGLTVTSADGLNSLTLRSRMQLRETYQYDAATGESTNEVQVKTLRLFVQGHVFSQDFKYTIQLAFGAGDFEKDSASPIFDAYVEYVKHRDLEVRVGQYFVPFDRARTIREFALQFVDRQQVVRELTLDRDVGMMLSSKDLLGWGSRLGYHLFLGGGDGRNRVADFKNQYGPQRAGMLAIGRLVVKPFGVFEDYDQEADLSRSKRPRLGIGVAGGYNYRTDRAQSTYGATYTFGTFNYTHLAADLHFKCKGFSLLTEYVRREANRDRYIRTVDMTQATQYSRSGHGYFVQAGQMLTDKVEVTARWDDLYAMAGTDPELTTLAQKSGRQVGAGLNLYLNGHALKVQSDYFYIFDRVTHEPRHAVRAQLDATF